LNEQSFAMTTEEIPSTKRKRGRSKPASVPAEPPIDEKASARTNELNEIGIRLKDLDRLFKRLVDQKWANVGAVRDLLDGKIREVDEERAALVARKIEVSSGVELSISKPQPEPPQAEATWPIRNLSKPEYPAGIRALNPDDDRIYETHAKFVDFHIDVAYRAAADAGDKPMAPVAMVDFMALHGEALAIANWNGMRTRELEQRVSLVESLADTRFSYCERRLADIAATEAGKSVQLESRVSDLERQPLKSNIADLEQRLSDVTALEASVSAAIEQRLAILEADQSIHDLERRLVDVAALQGSTIGGLQQRLAEVETKAVEVETKAREVEKFGAVERRIADLELKSRVVKSVTNVVGWDDAGRITRTEKLEGQSEFIDVANKLAELEQRLVDVLEGSLIELLVDDGRFVLRRWMKDGRTILETRNQTRAPIYRGVHDHKRTYLPGDMVSRGGSVWHCDVECSGPFNGDRFTLAVKKGRDGAHHD
jgi:hypothetical protein